MKYSATLLLFLATASTARAAKEARVTNRVRRDLGHGKHKETQQEESSAAIEAMMEIEALTVDVENLMEEVAEIEAEIVEEAESEEELVLMTEDARGNKRDQAGNRGRHKDKDKARTGDDGSAKKGTETRFQTRERGGEKTRGGRGDRRKPDVKNKVRHGGHRKRGRAQNGKATGGHSMPDADHTKNKTNNRGDDGRVKGGRPNRNGKARK